MRKACLFILFALCSIMFGCEDVDVSPVPVATPAFMDGYQINLEKSTFLLQIAIRPDPKKDTALILAIDGVLDESQYFLLAHKLRILDANTGEELQSFPLSYCDEPLTITTLSMVDALSGEVVVEDLNFDGCTDFRIIANAGTAGTEVYVYWTWNADSESFDESAELRALKLCNPKFDTAEQTITSEYADSASDNEVRTYRYIDGKPRMVKWVRYRTDSYDFQIMTTVELQDGGIVVTEEYIEE